MIPLSLSLQGFLSYRSPVNIDFTSFDLACISGQNGAGKSSLLDAITWVLFGMARKRDDSLVNAQSLAAEVSFVFKYEQNTYRVQRTLPRGKTTLLEFHIQQDPAAQPGARNNLAEPAWKALTERTLRDTQARIEETLRLDYDTFVNASFFLQGKADQFTQQRPGDRKRILGSILGLEIWDTYRDRAAGQRKEKESAMTTLDGRLGEINAELQEEAPRKDRLKSLQAELIRLSRLRATQEAALENIRKIAATLAQQRKMVETLARQVETSRKRLDDQQTRLAARRAERQKYAGVMARSDEIEQAHKAWTQAREDLAYWDQVAARFREQEKLRQGPLTEINAARVRLVQEQVTLQAQSRQVLQYKSDLNTLTTQVEAHRLELAVAEGKLARRTALDGQLQAARQNQADARAENPRLKASMDELKAHIDQINALEGATCPFCGQTLTQDDRLRLVDELTRQGTDLGDRFRANQVTLRETDEIVREMEDQMRMLARADAERTAHNDQLSRLTARQEVTRKALDEWLQGGEPRLLDVNKTLEEDRFAPEARSRLAEIDAQLTAIGYDIASHEKARQAETSGRQAEAALMELERARAALAPLDREIGELAAQIEDQQTETTARQQELDQAIAALAAAEAQAPDLFSAERDLMTAREQENRLRLDVGAAQQKVDVLDSLKNRRKALEADRQELARLVGQFRQLEKAFGKDGVPALLIEQALPQIESRANDILERLSGGNMSVQFVTQAQYKDRRRDDLKETLDIQIRDGAGVRDYEMYSGGEAFRVNFAVRLALSEVLAQRAGARLQTLVIDEGFGSQDTQGRQRLVEAINLVRKDFAMILVITHIDELKDVFPTRIEVEKGPDGSQVKII